jgi:predicted enzyme related to lactoylglutathione lyase
MREIGETHQQKGKNMSNSENKQAASIVWFGIPADNPERARAFYSDLFGWKINPAPEADDFWYIDTGGADETPDGGLTKKARTSARTDYQLRQRRFGH